MSDESLTIKSSKEVTGMERLTEMNWTDGTGSALQKAGAILKKSERASHDDGEDYFSNPRLFVMDLDTGSQCIIRTKPHEGEKTQGHGYRRCASVRQRIAAKLPMKKVMGRLLRMTVRSFVPKDAPADQISVVTRKAIDDIAAEIADDSKWSIEDDKYGNAVTSAISEILGNTWSERAGDTVTCLEAVPVPMAVMNTEMMKSMEEEEYELGQF